MLFGIPPVYSSPSLPLPPPVGNLLSDFHHIDCLKFSILYINVTILCSFCFISLTQYNLRTFHVISPVSSLFLLWLSNKPLHTWITICAFTWPSGCFQFETNKNKTALKTCVQVFVRTHALILLNTQ